MYCTEDLHSMRGVIPTDKYGVPKVLRPSLNSRHLRVHSTTLTPSTVVRLFEYKIKSDEKR